MKPRPPVERAAARPRTWRTGVPDAGGRLRPAVESGALAVLLLGVVSAAMAGSGYALFFVLVASWLALAVIVGPRNVLDAGCVFMLLTIGIVLTVDLAVNGPAAL